jgi:hypothetical protein
VDKHSRPLTRREMTLTRQTLRYGDKCEILDRAQAIVMRQLLLRDKRSREALLIALESNGGAKVIDVHVSRLRQHLKAMDAPFGILSIRGWGYELVDSEQWQLDHPVENHHGTEVRGYTNGSVTVGSGKRFSGAGRDSSRY